MNDRDQPNSFIVKIWSNDSSTKMRGFVQHVSSQEIVHFFTFDKMVNFIMKHVKPSSDKSEDGDHFEIEKYTDEENA